MSGVHQRWRCAVPRGARLSAAALAHAVAELGRATAGPAAERAREVRENRAAMHGPLPDAALRKRMRSHLQSISGFDALQSMPWYPDKTYPGLVAQAQQAVRSRL